MKQKLLSLVFSFFILSSYAQNTWLQKANFGGTARQGSVGFSIGSKGYCGTGFDGTLRNDFWEYNPATNVWTQKANFGGSARYQAVGFSIGSKGYLGTGSNTNDFWEYNPANNLWTQKAPYGGPACSGAVGFSIGSKGYLGTGFLGNTFFNDFWEYDPISDSWLQRANFGGQARGFAAGFAIGNKGYVGSGTAGFFGIVDFWEFNPSNNSWTQKANIMNSAPYGSSGFCIGTKGYIIGGVSFINRYNDLWEYNPLTDSWIQRLNFPGNPMGHAIGFSIGNKGYFGIGSALPINTNEFYEYTPIPSLTTNSISGSPLCAGNSIQVGYTTTTNYFNGNTFAAQLSDASGSFANPVTIGVITAINSGTIPSIIPANTPAGSLYRIRVVSSLPVDIGKDNGVDLIICSVTWPVSLSPVCVNGPSFPLTGGNPSGGTYAGPGVTNGIFDPSLVPAGTYTLSYSYTNITTGCTCSTTNSITVRALPVVTWPVSFASICGNGAPFLLNGGQPSGGTYSGPGVDAFGNFDPMQVPFGTTMLTYTYSDAFGCINTANNSINIINCIDCGECFIADTNQIINGDFENGNTGFTSTLPYVCNCYVGSYCVTTEAYLKCINFFHVKDHTSGNGNFLVIDGMSGTIWEQNVNVVANINYTFSFWVHPQVSSPNANPILDISINNVSLGTINTALLPKHWYNLVFSYSSNSSGNFPIKIRQFNTGNPGYDYGIDDISFNSCTPIIVTNGGPDREICSGDTVHLNASNNLFTNNWYEINSGDPANYPFIGSGNVVVSPAVNTCYLLISCYQNCCDTDSVCIVVHPKPIVSWPISYSDVCINQDPIHLIDGLPSGGTYSGPGVSGNYFDPASATLGINVLTYSYTNEFGCKDSVTNTIRVKYCVECGPCFNSGPDLVVNGDFENGNTGFSSGLSLLQSCSFGSYYTDYTADQKCNQFYNIHDHTTGSGKYMVIDGHLEFPRIIWLENVSVSIGNTYKYSFWMHPALSGGGGRANIEVLINGQVKMNIVGQNVPNQWTNFIISWVADVSGPIQIVLRQTNFGIDGFDYGLDDIVFKECIPILEVTWPVSFADVCPDDLAFPLTGGMPSGGTYSGQGVIANSFDPTSLLPGTYILTYTYTDNNGCTNYTTNTITVLSPPVVTWSFSYAPVCSDLSPFALGGGMPSGGIYSGQGVDASGFFHPASVPFGNSFIYYTYTDSHGCSTTVRDTLEVIHCVPCGPCFTPGPDLISNGNFESGNAGFISNLPLSCTCLFGSYCVTTSSINKCNTFFNIPDHTSGSGNYLVVDGDQFVSNIDVWNESVNVSTGITYKFSFWLHPALSNGTGKALLNVRINNQNQLTINCQFVPNQWTNYTVSWTSNVNGSIPISIRQINFGGNGFDYGLDDISINACVPLNVEANAGPDQEICLGDSATLNNLAGTSCDWYSINTADPGNNTYVGSGTVKVAPEINTCYLLICCSGLCCDTDTVCITVHQPPIVTWATSYEAVCDNDPPFLLTGGTPAGGVYSGNAAANGYFYPSLGFDPASKFRYNVIYYNYTDVFGCTAYVVNYIPVYYCPNCGQCYTTGNDLIVNGDFSAGNTGFTSDLISLNSCSAGTYLVTSNANQKCNSFYTLYDFPNRNGNFLVIDGDGFQPKDVWKETVSVTAGKTYLFSFWVTPSISNNFWVANLELIIDGTSQLIINGQNLQYPWNNFPIFWQSNTTGNIQIVIRQTNFGFAGYDCGIDKIEFKECIPDPLVTWTMSLATICTSHEAIQLTGGSPSGGTYSGSGVTDGYFDPSGLSPGNYLLSYTYTNASGCSHVARIMITVISCPVELDLKLIIEGYYLSGGIMKAVIDPDVYPQLCDTIIVELHSPVSPFELIYSIKGVINVFGNGVFTFPPGVFSNSYFIVVRHRNTIETWSKAPVLFNGTIVNFDFTR